MHKENFISPRYRLHQHLQAEIFMSPWRWMQSGRAPQNIPHRLPQLALKVSPKLEVSWHYAYRPISSFLAGTSKLALVINVEIKKTLRTLPKLALWWLTPHTERILMCNTVPQTLFGRQHDVWEKVVNDYLRASTRERAIQKSDSDSVLILDMTSSSSLSLSLSLSLSNQKAYKNKIN